MARFSYMTVGTRDVERAKAFYDALLASIGMRGVFEHPSGGRLYSGKGMAGLAWQHDKPIQTCNLKDDNSGAVKPGAKAVDARAAVALPVHDAAGAVRAIVGLAWMDERVLDDATLDAISRDSASLP